MSQPTSLSNHVATDNASDVARMRFIITSALSGVRTSMPVEVVSCTNSGGVSPIGSVAIKPLVSAVDGDGKLWEHGTIYNVPYSRLQGGSNAVILDPEPGDIGLASICDRDISTVKNTAAVSGPGSLRKHDMSDAVYLMTVISKSAPTQYVQFSAAGINIVTPGAVDITSASLTHNGVNIGATHKHGGVTSGGSNTTTPV